MNKQQLKNLCDHFGQANDGLVVTLRERLRRYLRDHQEALENNPNYQRLYPRHRGQGLQQPPNREEEPNNEEGQSQHDNFNDREERDTASSFSSFYGCAEGQDNEPNVLSPPPPSSRTLSMHCDTLSPLRTQSMLQSTPFHDFDAHQCENQPEVYQGLPLAAHITEGTSNSSRKRPPRVPGMLAQSASYTVPDQIQKKFSAEGGWASHIPLTFLTDKFCAQKNGVSVDMINNSLSVDPNSDQIITTSQSLPVKNETDLTFDEWHQAWRRLLKLIQQYIPQDYTYWEIHFCRIHDADSCSEHWPLWVAYDTEVRRRAVHEGIDPKQHHIGLWNELEVRYNQTQVVEAMNCANPIG
ncbi:hypothetical protein CVT25_009447 [Psilocybe cyanescens]|uniref:SAP domain-containing protein n=1 Tax=Psilocybe cyanescens TaxID=93625 RepID=A0A409WVZ2_PSICY|nr:hypothetical protein CVT25_009447 [Psilocybe cyanescens]